MTQEQSALRLSRIGKFASDLPSIKVLFVMRGSSSMKPHWRRMSSSAEVGEEERRCASSSKEEMKGDTVAPASGAGAP